MTIEVPHSGSPSVVVDGVSKVYRLYDRPRHRLFELLSGGRLSLGREVHAVDNVSLILERGDRLGVMGENGSGKSTLLKLITSVLTPSSGHVAAYGRIAALLELGAGFNPSLTGVENIDQFCLLHGLSKDEAEIAKPEIVAFSELGEYVRQPLKTYSSGMALRLGFACAVYVKPDILIVDEALSVGDAYFQNKCLQKIKSMLDEGVTFIYVTHAPDSVRSLCNKGIWLDHGKIREIGTASEVSASYQSEMFSRMAQSGSLSEASPENTLTDVPADRVAPGRRKEFASRVAPLRVGSAEAQLTDISIISSDGRETDTIEFDEEVRVRVYFRVDRTPPEGSSITLGVTDRQGRQIIHFNSAKRGVFISTDAVGKEWLVEFCFRSNLCPGEYGLIGGIGPHSDNPQNPSMSVIASVVDYCAGGARFSVKAPRDATGYDLWGVIHVPYTAEVVCVSELSDA